VLIDLHTHSTASDGTDAPGQLVRHAAAAGVDVLAITDHDTTLGWAAAAEALAPGQTLVRGAELSCTYEGISLHLLGYLFDPSDAPLLELMEQIRDDRVPRAREMVRRLEAAGYPVTWEAVSAQVPDGATVGRPHIADALVAAGAVPDRDAAFAELLHGRSPYFVRHFAADPVETIGLVHAAGGVTVFAHPAASRRGRTVGDDVIAALAAAGLAGLEVDHPDQSAAERARLRGLAAELGLLVTGSSDFHGEGKANRLGEESTAPEVLDALVARASGVGPVAA
jgi:predicted metal-dependent phosphoesterase TrpH